MSFSALKSLQIFLVLAFFPTYMMLGGSDKDYRTMITFTKFMCCVWNIFVLSIDYWIATVTFVIHHNCSVGL